MDRRQFVKVTAVTGASATLAGCGNPENEIIRRFISDELLPSGVAVWRPGICPLCPAGCGILVRIMQGDAEVIRDGEPGLIKKGLAKKLEGNPDHPVSQGKLCVRGQAAIQVTYHPDRITGPLRRSGPRGSGEFQPVSWEEAMAELVGRLDALAESGNPAAARFLTRPLRGQQKTLVGEFLARFGAPAPVIFEVFEEQVLRRANGYSFGYTQLPTFDLARSRYVVGFGADFLGTWNSPVSQNVGYGEMRQGRGGVRGKFVQVEARMSQTGANADEWVPVRPGTEGVLALGIAHVIMSSGLRPASGAGRAGALVEGWSDGLPAYAPEDVERLTGVAAARVERLAREFADTAPAVAIIGGAPLAHTNGMFHALGVNALNALVGSIGQPGGLSFTPRPDLMPESGAAMDAGGVRVDRLATEILAAEESPVRVLLLNDTNPVFGCPPGWRVGEALARVPFVVSFGSFLDETSILADLILPDHSFLETWVDDIPETGTTMSVASLAAPAMRPLHDTRAMPDVLLEAGRRLARPLDPPLPWETYEQMLDTAFSRLPAPPDAFGGAFGMARGQGGIWNEAPAPPSLEGGGAPDRAPAAFVEPQFDGDTNEYAFHFLPYASQAFLDGSLAHLPWLQELPDVLSTAMWSSWVEINPQTAASRGIAQGDLVEIASAHGVIQAPALLFPGIAPNVIAMPVGQGHETFTRYASGRGSNPIRVLAPVAEPETGSLAWAATRVRITRVEGTGGLILFAGGMREHETHGR